MEGDGNQECMVGEGKGKNVTALFCLFFVCWFLVLLPYQVYGVTACPQRSNAARVRSMSRSNGGKFPGNLKRCFKSEKIKQFLEREALNVEYLWKSFCLITSDFITSYFALSLYF